MKYEPVLRKPTGEEKRLFTPDFLESLFEGDEIPQSERCTTCGGKLDPETPIQIGEPIICGICADEME